MDKKIKNNLIIVICLNIFLLLVFLGFLYIVGKSGNVEMEKSISELNQLERLQGNFSTYNRAIKDTEEERARLDSFVINKKTAAGFIEEIESLGNRAGVEVSKTVSVEKQTPQIRENMLRFIVRARGKSSNVFYFLTLLEDLPYKIRFRSLSVGMSDEGTRSDLLQVSAVKGSQTKEVVWAGEATFELLSYINE